MVWRLSGIFVYGNQEILAKGCTYEHHCLAVLRPQILFSDLLYAAVKSGGDSELRDWNKLQGCRTLSPTALSLLSF